MTALLNAGLPLHTTPKLLLAQHGHAPSLHTLDALPSLLAPGDVVIVNDAATFPGSLRFTWAGASLEARLFEKIPHGFRAVLFGEGDHTTRTEHRAPPPIFPVGTVFRLAGLEARITRVCEDSARLVELTFDVDDVTLWAAVYAHGAPIQYAHAPERFPLWAVQNVYSARPWAAELPSAGHHLTWARLDALLKRGVEVHTLTHATGLSSTGDAVLDAQLPWPERYEIPLETRAAVTRAKRVIAVGTSVMRALEAWAQSDAPAGIARNVLGADTPLRVVDGLLTGIHQPGESHHRLLGSLLDGATLHAATQLANEVGLQGHEFGDVALFWGAMP